MNGCEGCLSSNRGQQEQLNIVRSKAKDHAKEKNVSVAIYKEGLEYSYIEAAAAFRGGYYIIEVVSQYQ